MWGRDPASKSGYFIKQHTFNAEQLDVRIKLDWQERGSIAESSDD